MGRLRSTLEALDSSQILITEDIIRDYSHGIGAGDIRGGGRELSNQRDVEIKYHGEFLPYTANFPSPNRTIEIQL